MKNKKETGNLKKQLVSGAVYIALAVTVVAVTISTITATFSDNNDRKALDNTLYNHYDSDTNLKLPDNTGMQTDTADVPDVKDYTLDTPVSDVAQGVDATLHGQHDKTDKQTPDTPPENPETTPDAEANTPSGATAPLPEAEEAVPLPDTPDKSKPLSEEPAEPTFEVGYQGYIKPCSGYIGKEFSMDMPVYSATMYDYRTHQGIDIACEPGSPVRAVTNGVISAVYNDYLYGTTVVIEHADGVSSVYRGLSPELPVETVTGRSVLTGETIGGIGNSALVESAEVSHLHFEMTKDGKYIDPTEYIGG